MGEGNEEGDERDARKNSNSKIAIGLIF